MERNWADPEWRAKTLAALKAKARDPEHRARERLRSADPRTYRWQEVATGRIVKRTRLEMQDEFGLRSSAIAAMLAGTKKTVRGWRVLPLSLLGEAPRWIFP